MPLRDDFVPGPDDMEAVNLPKVNLGRGLFDRVDYATMNILQGDVKAAVRGLVTPDTLSPHERRSLAQRLGIDKTPMAELVNIVANPVALVGLLMTMKWPLPTAAELSLFNGKLGNIKARAPWIEFLAPATENYPGSKLGVLADTSKNVFLDTKVQLERALGTAVEAFRTKVGRDFTPDEFIRAAAHRDGLDNPKSHVWKQLNELLTEHTGRDFSPEIAAIKMRPMTEGESIIADGLAKVSQKAAEQLKRGSPDDIELIHHVLREMHGLDARITPGKLKFYTEHWPHLPTSSLLDSLRSREAYLASMTATPMRTLLEHYRQRKPLIEANKGLAIRLGHTVPQAEHLNRLDGLPDDLKRALGSLENATVQYIDPSSGLQEMTIRGYTLLPDAIQTYIDRHSRMVAYTIPPYEHKVGLGFAMQDEMNRVLGAAPKGSVEANLNTAKVTSFRGHVLPQLLGSLDEGNYLANASFEQIKMWAVQKLENPAMRQFTPEPLRRVVSNWLTHDRNSSLPGLSSNLASYFYASTLGFPNIVSPLQNLTQMLALVGVVRPRDLAVGVKESVKQVSDYVGLRMRGRTHQAAFDEAMGDFAAMHLEVDPRAHEVLNSTVSDALRSALLPGKVSRTVDSVLTHMMSVFRGTETFNKMTAFNAGRNRALTDKSFIKPGTTEFYFPREDVARVVQDSDLAEVGRQLGKRVTGITQYGSGISETPSGLLNVNPLLKMFFTYGGRTAHLALMRHPGTTGRLLLASGLAYGTAKEYFDTDIQRMLLYGAIPTPSENLPFSPLPIVPPILQIAGAAGAAAFGQTEYIAKALPLLVPGGVGLSRMVPALGSEAVSTALNRPYIDWDRPITGNDGSVRYPQYAPNGGLTGYMSLAQIVGRAWGMPSVDERQEAIITGYMVKQRDRIRALKRDWLQSKVEGDEAEAMKIQQEYARAYPGTPFPIKRSDIEAVHLRRDVGRMERTLQTMPEGVRPIFTAMISATLGANSDLMLGLQENGLMQAPSITTRDQYRARPRTWGPSGNQPSMHGVDLRDKMKMAGIVDKGDQRAGAAFGKVESQFRQLDATVTAP